MCLARRVQKSHIPEKSPTLRKTDNPINIRVKKNSSKFIEWNSVFYIQRCKTTWMNLTNILKEFTYQKSIARKFPILYNVETGKTTLLCENSSQCLPEEVKTDAAQKNPACRCLCRIVSTHLKENGGKKKTVQCCLTGVKTDF